MADTVTITINETPDTVAVSITEGGAAVNETPYVFDDVTANFVSIPSPDLSPLDAMTDAQIATYLFVYVQGNLQRVNKPWGYKINSGAARLEFTAQNTSTLRTLATEDVVVIVRKLT